MPLSKSKSNPTSNWLFDYLASGIVWGCSFLFIALAVTMLPPTGVGFWRMFFGAVPLLVIALFKRQTWPRGLKNWLHLLVISLTMNALPSVLFAYAETQVSSALAGIMNAATPITTVLVILIAFRAEKPRRHLLVGLGIGFIGVLVVLGVWNGFGEADSWAIAALALAVTLYGIGGPYARRFVSPMKLGAEMQVVAQTGLAAVLIAPFYFSGPLLVGPITWPAVLGILLLGSLGTGIAYIWYYRLMNVAGSAIANSVTYLSPLVAVIAGAILLGETITWFQIVGGCIVIFGAALSQGRLNRLFGIRS